MDDHGNLPLLLARIASLERRDREKDRLIGELRQQVKMATRASEIIRAADGTGPMPAVPPQPRSHVRPKRDRSHLRVVRGIGIVAVAGPVARWLWGSSARRVTTVAAGLAIGGATVLTPAVHAAGSPPQPHTQFRSQRPAATAPGGPPLRHHTRATAGTRRPQAHGAPSPVPSPSPSPSPSVVPLPSPTLPVPLPTPPPPPVTGCLQHPHPGCPTPPADLPSLPGGRVTSAREWLIKTQRLRLHQLQLAA